MAKFLVSSYKEASERSKAVMLGFVMGVSVEIDNLAESLENQQQRQGVVK